MRQGNRPGDPYSDRSSPFVHRCLEKLPEMPGAMAADLGCGAGRHASLLADKGLVVLAFDLPPHPLAVQEGAARRGQLHPVCADVHQPLPVRAGSLALALAVHCCIHDDIPAIAQALAPSGVLIYETFGGQGMNWVALPKEGLVEKALRSQFTIVMLQERAVGPREKHRVSVKLLARKLPVVVRE